MRKILDLTPETEPLTTEHCHTSLAKHSRAKTRASLGAQPRQSQGIAHADQKRISRMLLEIAKRHNLPFRLPNVEQIRRELGFTSPRPWGELMLEEIIDLQEIH